MILLSLILILLAGVFRAVHTIRKDKPEGNIFLVLTYTKGPRFNKWYWGGNQFYSPSWPWTADFWHFFVFMQIYAWTLAVISAAYWPCNWWVYVIAMMGEGWVFTWCYWYWFPLEPAGGFWHFLKRMLTFTNYHKGGAMGAKKREPKEEPKEPEVQPQAGGDPPPPPPPPPPDPEP